METAKTRIGRKWVHIRFKCGERSFASVRSNGKNLDGVVRDRVSLTICGMHYELLPSVVRQFLLGLLGGLPPAVDLDAERQLAILVTAAASGSPAAGSPAAGSPVEEAFEIFMRARNRVEFYDDVRPALVRLRSTYRLFAVSNGNADLNRCGIADLFDGHITASAAGAAKPDTRIFAHLLSVAGVEAHEVLHIGDDPLADVVGATQAGMRAVWLNREARAWPEHFAPPLRTIATLAEIT